MFFEVVLEYLAELKTSHPYRFMENVSVTLGFPKIIWERETSGRMNFPQPWKEGRWWQKWRYFIFSVCEFWEEHEVTIE